MFLKDFNASPQKKIAKLNKMLKEQFNMNIAGFPSKENLEAVLETTNKQIFVIRGSNKKFHLEPEYAKFLGIKDITETMLAEGMYAESPKYNEMKQMIAASVQELMDGGYTMDEACSESMNRFRKDPRWAYDDEHVLPMVLKAGKDYMEACGMEHDAVESAVFTMPETDLNEKLLMAMAEECGVKLSDSASIDAIEEKLGMFANVAGKSRDAVVGFLNGLDEDAMQGGIQMFGRKIGEANKYVKARKDAIKMGSDEFEVGGVMHSVTGDTSDEKLDEGMFDMLIRDLLKEDVDVEQAEVVMAVRALADDMQSSVERLGRMINEDLPAITDQMRAEMGATQAQAFYDQTSQLLSQHLEATRQVKSQLDQSVSTMTGGEAEMGLGGMDVAGEPDMGMGDEMGMEDPVDNIPAMQGPEDEPLGRAEI